MKTQINYLAILFLAISVCITSCGKIEEIGVENETIEAGFLNIKAQLKEEKNVTAAGKPPTLDAILDDLTVEIYQEDITGFFSLYISSNYRDLPPTIELPTGYYRINMFSATFSANQFTGRFDNPDYGWTGDFTILSGDNTVIDATLNLFDTAVTIDFTDEVLTEYPGIIVEAAIAYPQTGLTEFQSWTALEDESIAYYSMSEIVVLFDGYTNIQALTNTLSIQVSASSGFVTRTYENIAPNEHYRITVSYSGDSSATINVTLGDETIIEDEIPFPG